MRFDLPRLIGITGRAGSGKDTLADYLVRKFGYRKYSLAGPIKKLLADRFGFPVGLWEDREFKDQPSMEFGRGPGPDGLYSSFSPRSWVQWLGTEVGRMIGGEDVWVDMMAREWLDRESAFLDNRDPMRSGNEFIRYVPHPPRMVVSDVRFDNEARRIRALGGVVIRVTRPEAEGAVTHASERGVSDDLVNVQVANDKDVLTYVREAVAALRRCPRGV